MITRRKSIARSMKPIPRRRAKPRRGPLRCLEYLKFLKKDGFCSVCWFNQRPLGYQGDPFNNIIDPAHTENGGRSMKGPDSSCAPLCRVHHDQYDGRAKLPNGEVGHSAFDRYYAVDMKKVAAEWWALFPGAKP